VLLAADGIGTNEIVRRTGASKPMVIRAELKPQLWTICSAVS
jgi:hypothetical protein